LALLVAGAGGIDQFLMQHPEYVLEQGQARVLCNPYNRFILGAHLLCAAYELPLDPLDAQYFGPEMEDILGVLTAYELLDKRRRWYGAEADRYPAAEFSLRSGSGPGYDIVVGASDELLGTVDDGNAFWLVHPGAVYLHAGESYLVRELDLPRRRAVVDPAEPDYFTRPLSVSEVTVLEEADSRQLRGAVAHVGEVLAHSQMVGYTQVDMKTSQERGSHPLELPAQDFETVGLWVTSAELPRGFARAEHDLMGSLHALEHALITLLPVFVNCDPHDLGGVSYLAHPDTDAPGFFVYDAHAGGVGLAEEAYEHLEEILEATAAMIERCSCAEGCPGCVQSPSCGNQNRPLDKAGAAYLARAWLGQRPRRRPQKRGIS
jgi:DEAD/DEAH box helicase domain-containing protein